MKSLFLKALYERGFIHQCTNENALDVVCKDTILPAYIGFDVTADSLHVGSLLSIMMLRHLQKTGHKPIVLLGGATTRIGDPTGKDRSRKVLSDAEIHKNTAGIEKIFKQFLRFGDGKTDAIILNNESWLSDLNYMNFLGKIGRHFSINKMLSFDSVRLRLNRQNPLSFLEFNYMVLQAYDFMELSIRHGVALQMGGSDQWGNIINGVDLCRRLLDRDVYGLTCPLLTTTEGKKMGKSEEGAVWLNKEKTSDLEYWQFWRNTKDDDVVRFLHLFTEVSLEEIKKLASLKGAEINVAKTLLANEVTKLCRGQEAARRAHNVAQATFERGEYDIDLPTVTQTIDNLEKGVGVLSSLVALGFVASHTEARQYIKAGAVKVNNEKVSDQKMILTILHVQDNVIRISFGKKKYGLIKCL